MLLWLWWRLAAIAPIPPLAWEPPYAVGVALEKINNFFEERKEGKARKEENIRPVFLTHGNPQISAKL